jgi:hypothetical protein
VLGTALTTGALRLEAEVGELAAGLATALAAAVVGAVAVVAAVTAVAVVAVVAGGCVAS